MRDREKFTLRASIEVGSFRKGPRRRKPGNSCVVFVGVRPGVSGAHSHLGWHPGPGFRAELRLFILVKHSRVGKKANWGSRFRNLLKILVPADPFSILRGTWLKFTCWWCSSDRGPTARTVSKSLVPVTLGCGVARGRKKPFRDSPNY